MYEHPDLRPWPSYERVVKRGKPAGVLMHTYGRAHEIPRNHLLARGLHGQFVEDNGWRLLHPSECRALMALPPFQAANYTEAWRLVGNALPGTFAVRSIGIWLCVRYQADLVLPTILQQMVRHTQLAFAERAPVGTLCSDHIPNLQSAAPAVHPYARAPITQQALPASRQAEALGGLYPAAEHDRVLWCVRIILTFLAADEVATTRRGWVVRRILSNRLQVALEPRRYNGRGKHRAHNPMTGKRIGEASHPGPGEVEEEAWRNRARRVSEVIRHACISLQTGRAFMHRIRRHQRHQQAQSAWRAGHFERADNSTSLAIALACTWAHSSTQPPPQPRWRYCKAVRHVKQRIGNIKEELRLLRLKQRLMRPLAVRNALRQERHDRTTRELTGDRLGRNHDPNVGQRIGEASNPGPTQATTRKLPQRTPSGQGPPPQGRPTEPASRPRRRQTPRLLRIVSGILLLSRALGVFDPTSVQGDGPDSPMTTHPHSTPRESQTCRLKAAVRIASANITSLHGV